MSECTPFFCDPTLAQGTLFIDRSLIPEYFPPGEKVENPEPIAELSESDDELSD